MAQTVLIVDDNNHLRDILGTILRFYGYEILEAATGAQAIEKAFSAKPNLILLDFDLPDIAGLDTAIAIKRNPITADIPIIGCSASTEMELRKEALRAGMVEFLEKPIQAAVIAAKIQKFISSER